MRILITAGPTWEAIDAVRYIANRSSGRMGTALAQAAIRRGHAVEAIVGPGVGAMSPTVRRVEVESARQMHERVIAEFPSRDVLIMAAAVSDFRPRRLIDGKLPREGMTQIELEPTEDIVASAARMKLPNQSVVAFSLEQEGQLDRAQAKMQRKAVDLMVYNPINTMGSDHIDATLLWPDGTREALGCRPKEQFADLLLDRIERRMNRTA